jgi:hypothetical protein
LDAIQFSGIPLDIEHDLNTRMFENERPPESLNIGILARRVRNEAVL